MGNVAEAAADQLAGVVSRDCAVLRVDTQNPARRRVSLGDANGGEIEDGTELLFPLAHRQFRGFPVADVAGDGGDVLDGPGGIPMHEHDEGDRDLTAVHGEQRPFARDGAIAQGLRQPFPRGTLHDPRRRTVRRRKAGQVRIGCEADETPTCPVHEHEGAVQPRHAHEVGRLLEHEREPCRLLPRLAQPCFGRPRRTSVTAVL
jgi:hypothetical protein